MHTLLKRLTYGIEKVFTTSKLIKKFSRVLRGLMLFVKRNERACLYVDVRDWLGPA